VQQKWREKTPRTGCHGAGRHPGGLAVMRLPATAILMKHTLRTFVAVEIDSAVRARAGELIEALRASGAKAKWVEPQNLHLTLEVRGVGAFPRSSRPRTVWLGAGGGEEKMVALHGQVEAALAKLGFREEQRRFHPHLTLGRVRGGGPAVAALGRLVQQHAEFNAGRLGVSQLSVFSSHLDPSGPTYEVLGRATLGGT
jgi:2'-5' RNA ligase